MGQARQTVGAAPDRLSFVRTADALRLAFEAPTAAIIAVDIDGTVLFVNRTLVELCDIPPDMVERGRFDEMVEQSRKMLAEPYRDRPCMRLDDEQEREECVTLLDGRVMRRRSTPVRDPQTHRLIGQVLSFTDITAEDRALRALHDSEEQARRHAAELEAARRAVAVASHVKKAFLSHMSHELRTPLNAIIGFAQLLALDPSRSLSPKQQEHLAHIAHGGDHLLAMIEQLLDLARIEADQIELNMSDVDPTPLVDASLDAVRLRAQRRQVDLQWRSHEPMRVRADPVRLRQVLAHLINNAVKYNRVNGRVTVSMQRVGEALRFEVCDTGIGIAEHMRARLFNPFERLDADRGPIEGAGIGLAICRYLIEMMGGKIGVQSEPDKGSTFWFTLAGAPPASTPDAAHSNDR
jgi:signal transduction histidine kinase